MSRMGLTLALILTIASGGSSAPARRRLMLDAACTSALGGRAGAAVVLRVEDGSLLGSAGNRILAQRAATPGSTIKPFVLELALEHHRIAPDMTLACRRHLTIAGKRLDCSHPDVGASYEPAEALAISCNSYFAVVGSRFAPGELERRYRELGFEHETGLLPKESTGRVSEAHSTEDRQLLALGAAGIEVTPLELATAYVKFAREAEHPTEAQAVVISGLRASTEVGLGRAAAVDKLSVAGKTGTASDHGASRTHAWFVGFAPADHPKIVVLVFVESGRGSTDAASIAHDIFKAYAETAL